nr:MAG TPA: hypothetical protein [Caudoviricetes sp.]
MLGILWRTQHITRNIYIFLNEKDQLSNSKLLQLSSVIN